MKQVISDDSINVKQIFSVTKLIFIYMEILAKKITDFGYTIMLA